MAAKSERPASLDQVVADFEDCRKYHDVFRQKADKRYSAYRGLLERRSDAAQWQSQQHPPLVLQVVETSIANIVESSLKFRVRPRPKSLDVETLQAHLDGARTMERLLTYEMDVDAISEKQRPFVLQGLITGLSVGKCYWRSREGTTRSLQTVHEPVYGDLGHVGTVPRIRETSTKGFLYDDPTFEVVNVKDFFWHEASIDVCSAPWLIHRVWKTFDELKKLEADGVYKDIDKLKESREFGREQDRNPELFYDANRTKDMVEVLEYWNKNKNQRVTVANRAVLIQGPEKFPFWHGEYPFVVTSSMPDLFRLPGVSQVETLVDLQEMLWNLMNQRLDNISLLNNAIVLIREDVTDPDSFDFAPLERWLVPDMDAVRTLEMNPLPAQISLEAEKLLAGYIQNVSGGGVFAGGTETQSVDQKTATGVSIITSLAQKMLASKKQNYVWAFQRVGNQFIQLIQQYMRDPKVIEIVGSDGATSFHEVSPEQVQGRYDVIAEPLNESLMRQERRAEAQTLFTMAVQAAPVYAAIGQPLNMKAFMDDLLDTFDKQDRERYFSQQPQQLPPQGQQQPAQAGAQGPGGITNVDLAAGPMSPSHPASLSGQSHLQQALAMLGGGRNV